MTAGFVKKGLPVVAVMVWVRNAPRPPSPEASRMAALSTKDCLCLEQWDPLLDLRRTLLEGRAVSLFSKLPSSS